MSGLRDSPMEDRILAGLESTKFSAEQAKEMLADINEYAEGEYDQLLSDFKVSLMERIEAHRRKDGAE